MPQSSPTLSTPPLQYSTETFSSKSFSVASLKGHLGSRKVKISMATGPSLDKQVDEAPDSRAMQQLSWFGRNPAVLFLINTSLAMSLRKPRRCHSKANDLTFRL